MLYAGAILAAILVYSPFGHAKDAASAPAAQEFWTVRCMPVRNDKAAKAEKDAKAANEPKYCEVFQRLAVAKKGEKNAKRLAEFAVGFPPDKKGLARGVVVVPLGVLLEKPIKIQLDPKTEFTFRARFCEPDGCYAFLDLSQDQIEQMKKSEKLTLTIPTLAGNNIAIIMSLKGFGPALDKLKSS